jgi:hypothetical protein
MQPDTQKSIFLPWEEEALIMPIGDVQYGVEACDVKMFKKHIEWGVDRNAYFIGMGDMVDFGSPSNRGLLRAMIEKGELYDVAENVLDNAASEHLEMLEEILEPTKGRWLGLLQGHHYYLWSSGATSDTKLAEFLEAPFLGDCAIVNVAFKKEKKEANKLSHRTANLNIWAAHGTGSGQTQAAPLAKLERLAASWEDIDIFLMGHQHKLGAVTVDRNRPVFGPRGGKPRIQHRTVRLISTGSFLRGYMVGNTRSGRAQGTYVEKRLLPPTALGGAVIYARPRFNDDGYITVDTNVSV